VKYFCLAAGLLCAGSLFAQPREIPFDSAGDFLKMPANIYFGEVAGVATTSKGNILVYTRTGGPNATLGASRIFFNGGSRLFEFSPSGAYVREIAPNLYAFLFAQGVKVDAQDNIWIIDRAAMMVVKINQAGFPILNLGRRPEAIGIAGGARGGGGGAAPGGPGGAAPGGGGRGAGAAPAGGAAPGGGGGGGGYGRGSGPPGSGTPGDNFQQPTDVAFDAQGNIFVADGYGNARIAKFDKNGKYIKSWGFKGADPGQFDTPHSIAVDAGGNVYVAEMGNKRIQVFDNNGTFKSAITNVGTPRAICISPGAHQYLFSSNSNEPDSPFDNGEIYKMELNGTVVGRFGHAGKVFKDLGTVNEIDCRDPNTLFVAELTNWRIQKLSLH
jgi:hypothetical protein